MIDRKLIRQLQSELRNRGKADYKGYTIVKQPTGNYWIGTSTGSDVIMHTSCQTVAECIKWIDAETEIQEV